MEINTKPVEEMSMIELETERDEIHGYLMNSTTEQLRSDPKRTQILTRAKQLISQAKILQAGIKNHQP